jgi:hypothetical protein
MGLEGEGEGLFSSFEEFTKTCLIAPYGATKLSNDFKEILEGEDLELSEKQRNVLRD